MDMFSTISKRLREEIPDFSLDTYSCLATQYKDGSAGIPLHQDNEQSIEVGSSIITLPFGATRTIKFRNQIGPIEDEYHELAHGSVNEMTRLAQTQWKHGIEAYDSVSGGSVSLTFRKMKKPEPNPKPTSQPGATQESPSPSDSSPSRPTTTPKRVLLLTDFILRGTQEHIFEQAPGHVCIKKTNFFLSEVDGFSPEFGHTDVVVVSCGINGIWKRGRSAAVLADVASGLFRSYEARYPRTKFAS